MENTFCSDLDETVIQRIHDLSQALNAPAKIVVENAVNMYASHLEKASDTELVSNTIENEENTKWLELTFGTWQREESSEETIQSIRDTFHQSMTRHQK